MANNHILIVDDQSLRALDMRNRLVKMGYDVISVIDGSEDSLTSAASNNPDLAILDFLYDVEVDDKSTEEMVKNVLGIPVLYVEASKKESSKVKVVSLGPIAKPFDDFQLKSIIELAIDSNRFSFNTAKHANRKKGDDGEILRRSPKGENEAFDFVKQVPIFAKLSDESLRELVRRSQFADVASGDYISFEGDHDEASFIVIAGRFAMTKSAASGKELVVELLGPRDFVGLMFALEDQPAELSARAQIDSEVLWIQTSVLLGVLKKNPELYEGFAEYLAHCLHVSHRLSHGLAHDSVKVRIASLLLTLVVKFARSRKKISDSFTIDVTRQQIADLAGTTAETATRVTRAMHLNGVIDCATPGALRIIDLEALRKIVVQD